MSVRGASATRHRRPVSGACLAALLLAAAALRFWRLGAGALVPDEAYYWLWSRHLAPAYYDHPAGVALLIRASALLGGQGEAGLRWLNAVLGLAAVALAYALGRCLGSPWAALGAALAAVGPAYVLTGRHVYPDALQLALLLATVLALLWVAERADPTRATVAWGGVGLLVALLLNTKYSAYLAAAMGLAYVVVRRPGLLRHGRPWLALGLALAGLAPVLAWNAARDWASFRWQLSHFAAGALHRPSVLASLRNMVDYLGAPGLALAALGVLNPRRTAAHWLVWALGIALAAPAALSPANSPRNLTAGLALLGVLAADGLGHWVPRLRPGWRGATRVALGLLLAGQAALGLGAARATLRPTRWPHPAAADAIRAEAAGWRALAASPLGRGGSTFAVDYSLAGQMSYYAHGLTLTAWPQYREWAELDLGDVTIVASTYLDAELLTARLRGAFDAVQGPDDVVLADAQGERRLRAWRVRVPRLTPQAFLEQFDFFRLWNEGALPHD